jgi:hypothetical protein
LEDLAFLCDLMRREVASSDREPLAELWGGPAGGDHGSGELCLQDLGDLSSGADSGWDGGEGGDYEEGSEQDGDERLRAGDGDGVAVAEGCDERDPRWDAEDSARECGDELGCCQTDERAQVSSLPRPARRLYARNRGQSTIE